MAKAKKKAAKPAKKTAKAAKKTVKAAAKPAKKIVKLVAKKNGATAAPRGHSAHLHFDDGLTHNRISFTRLPATSRVAVGVVGDPTVVFACGYHRYPWDIEQLRLY